MKCRAEMTIMMVRESMIERHCCAKRGNWDCLHSRSSQFFSINYIRYDDYKDWVAVVLLLHSLLDLYCPLVKVQN